MEQTMSKTATLLLDRDLSDEPHELAMGWTHDRKVTVRLEPPLGAHAIVTVSEVSHTYATETYVFPSAEDGEITDYGELDGSQKGRISAESVLGELGYELVIS